MSDVTFEKASQRKLRFDTARGRLSVEDLWDLPLKGADISLDALAIALHQQIRSEDEVSFVDDPPEPNEELRLRFAVIKRVIEVRLEEKKAAEAAEEKRQLKQQILGIIKDKENEDLKEASIEELQARLEDL